MKSPLRLESRKFKSSSALRTLIPQESVVHCYVTYDGEIEVDLANSGRYVVGHTNCYSIYEFWTCISHNPQQVIAAANYFDNIESKDIFYLLQETLPNYDDPFVRSALFFLLCKFSTLGQASRGAFQRDSYNPRAIPSMARLPFHSMVVKYDADDNFLDSAHNTNLRCDYVVIPAAHFQYDYLRNAEEEKSQYDETPINHDYLRDYMKTTDKKSILIYHFTPKLLKFYEGHTLHLVDEWGKITDKKENAVEVLVANF